MKRTDRRVLLPALVSLLVATSAYAGGWAIITVDDLPDCAVSGKPLILTFTVRQHGMSLLNGLEPTVRATAGRLETMAFATPAGNSGEYSAVLTFPQPGEWTIRINSGFNASASTLPTIDVIGPGSPSPMPLAPAARGQRLFVAKGCIGCHRHQEIDAESRAAAGPDLTSQHFSPAHLAEFLADPNKMLGRPSPLQYGQMPKLNLEEEEIAALVAFINKTRS